MIQVFASLNNPQHVGSVSGQTIKNLIKQYLPGNLNNFAGLPSGSSISEGHVPEVIVHKLHIIHRNEF